MKIAVIGANGKAGQLIVKEAAAGELKGAEAYGKKKKGTSGKAEGRIA